MAGIVNHHIQDFPVSSISVLSPYTGLILAVVLCALFLVRFYILELFLLERVYGDVYTRLDDTSRRSFLNHHIAGVTKILILAIGIYPFLSTVFGKASFTTPCGPGSIVTLGDILVVCSQMLVGMFIFELVYRAKISPVSVFHHLGSILVAQAAITISVEKERDSSIEFLLCTVWGAFDIVCEFLPHLSIILYRTVPHNHTFLVGLFRAACITTFIGTVCETIVTMYLFGQLWHRWELAFKIVTPLLHIAFSVTQFHGTRIFYNMWRKQEGLIREKEGHLQEQLKRGSDMSRNSWIDLFKRARPVSTVNLDKLEAEEAHQV